MYRRATLAALLIASTGVVLAGDAYKTYADKKHPPADTSILITEDDQNPAFIGSYIASVDGQAVGSVWAASVYAVRVLPGTHRFLIMAMWDKKGSLINGPISYKTDGYKIEVPDMQARHVYVTRWRLADGEVEMNIENLGERPDYHTVLAPKPRF
jgi:hypothetical protein